MPVAMLALFKCATLSGWGEIYQINMFGCAEYGDYYPSNSTVLLYTNGGSFYDYGCYKSKRQSFLAPLYFYSFTLLTAFVVLSLFVSVMCGHSLACRRSSDLFYVSLFGVCVCFLRLQHLGDV